MLNEKGIDLIPINIRSAEMNIHDDYTNIDSDGNAEVDCCRKNSTIIWSPNSKHYCSNRGKEKTWNCSTNRVLGYHICRKIIDHGIHDDFINIATNSYYERACQQQDKADLCLIKKKRYKQHSCEGEVDKHVADYDEVDVFELVAELMEGKANDDIAHE